MCVIGLIALVLNLERTSLFPCGTTLLLKQNVSFKREFIENQGLNIKKLIISFFPAYKDDEKPITIADICLFKDRTD